MTNFQKYSILAYLQPMRKTHAKFHLNRSHGYRDIVINDRVVFYFPPEDGISAITCKRVLLNKKQKRKKNRCKATLGVFKVAICVPITKKKKNNCNNFYDEFSKSQPK